MRICFSGVAYVHGTSLCRYLDGAAFGEKADLSIISALVGVTPNRVQNSGHCSILADLVAAERLADFRYAGRSASPGLRGEHIL